MSELDDKLVTLLDLKKSLGKLNEFQEQLDALPEIRYGTIAATLASSTTEQFVNIDVKFDKPMRGNPSVVVSHNSNTEWASRFCNITPNVVNITKEGFTLRVLVNTSISSTSWANFKYIAVCD